MDPEPDGNHVYVLPASALVTDKIELSPKQNVVLVADTIGFSGVFLDSIEIEAEGKLAQLLSLNVTTEYEPVVLATRSC